VLVLTNLPRPLLPVSHFLELLEGRLTGQPVFHRIQTVYNVYGNRGRAFNPLLARIPAECSLLGFYSSGDALETALWRPFGGRRTVHVKDADRGRILIKKSFVGLLSATLR